MIAYLVKHMDRSFETAAQIVASDWMRLALTEKRDITRALAVRLLNTDTEQSNARN